VICMLNKTQIRTGTSSRRTPCHQLATGGGMIIFQYLVVGSCCLHGINAADTFNEAFASSVFSDLSSLMKEPWDRGEK
jgi:hypothetical protein